MIPEAKQALEARALTKAKSTKTDDDDGLSRGGMGSPGDPSLIPVKGKAERNFKHPDSSFMRTSGTLFCSGV